jgi:hypothetical protein
MTGAASVPPCRSASAGTAPPKPPPAPPPSHPKARPEHPDPAPAPTGIDYLHLVAATHNGQLADRINYDALISQPTQPAQATDADLPADGQIPGQLDLTDLFGDGEREADR